MTITLKKLGCDFSQTKEKLENFSDLENHRLKLEFVGKDNITYFGDIHLWKLSENQKKYFNTDVNFGMFFDLHFNKENNTTFRKHIYKTKYNTYKVLPKQKIYNYSKQDLLNFLNEYSKDNYTEIEII